MRPPVKLASACLLLAAFVVSCEQPIPSRAPIATQTAAAATAAATAAETQNPSRTPTNPPSRGTAPPTTGALATPPASATPAAPPSPPTSPATSPAVVGSPGASAAFDPTRIELAFEPFAAGFEPLTLLTHAGDGSGLLYAVEQRGVVRVLDESGNVREEPFLDIHELVSAGSEQGLLGLAFHPGFASNGRVFVNYTDVAGDTVVAEYTATAEAADAATERAILRVDQPFGNHNGGMLAFGPDGYLYIGLGDGGGAGDPNDNAQDPGTLLGDILRIDVDAQQPYAIPADNPFVGEPGSRPEVWDWGLRNPWRFSFDRLTGALFIGDVGQGAWEEIDAEPAGTGDRNYGWNVMEGPDCYRQPACDATGLTPPVAAYPRADGNCSVIGGYVYRGTEQPLLAGGYLFSDYCSGEVWALDASSALAIGVAEHVLVGSSGISPGSFGEDEAGELYLAGQGGEILRIVARER